MSRIAVIALLATLGFFGWIRESKDNSARVSPASFTSSFVAASDHVENAPQRRSKIKTEALELENTLASLPKPPHDIRYITAVTLRMRAGPSAGAEMIGSYPRGTLVSIKEQDGDWSQVTAPDGRTGWMAVKYLSH